MHCMFERASDRSRGQLAMYGEIFSSSSWQEPRNDDATLQQRSHRRLSDLERNEQANNVEQFAAISAPSCVEQLAHSFNSIHGWIDNQAIFTFVLSECESTFALPKMDLLNLGCSSRRILALLESKYESKYENGLRNPFSTHGMLR